MPAIIPESPVCHRGRPLCRLRSFPRPVPYAEALALQNDLVQRRQSGEASDTLLLLEHPPTITLGRRTNPADLLTEPAALAARGLALVQVDRGGEISYHAPGQLVGYPILDLRAHGQDLHRFLRDLEEVLIRTLARCGLAGRREAGLTGVWTDLGKVAAIGIKVSRWVSLHGFALNIDCDLRPFRQDFVPCGIRDRGVTSLAELAPDRQLTRATVEPLLTQAWTDVFQAELVPALQAEEIQV